MDITSYLLGKKAGGGSQPPNLQTKEVEITTNTTTTISPDEGYDGLESVEVTTNVAGNPVNVSGNGTYTVGIVGTCLTELPQIVVTSGSCSYLLQNFLGLKKADIVFTQNSTNAGGFFMNCTSLKEVTASHFDYVTDMNNMFNGCTGLVQAPTLDTSNVTNMRYAFLGCSSLEDVPIYNTAQVYGGRFTNMFSGCTSLNNNSLNNIMQMCINATLQTTNKTLADLGLTQTQAETCMTLSNYAAFTAAGWTTGY